MDRSAWMISLSLALVTMSVTACKRSGDGIIVQDDSTTEWIWVADVFGENLDQVFEWTSTLNGVTRVEFKADEYSGLARVRVYDGNGDRVYDEYYGGTGSHFRESDFTNPALSGEWTIKIDLEDATGDLRVIIDRP